MMLLDTESSKGNHKEKDRHLADLKYLKKTRRVKDQLYQVYFTSLKIYKYTCASGVVFKLSFVTYPS